jgi:hypothetical protein
MSMQWILILTILSGHGQAVTAVHVQNKAICDNIGEHWVRMADLTQKYGDKFYICSMNWDMK